MTERRSAREQPPRKRPRVYLAGPDVFLPDPLWQAERKKDLCRRLGFEGVFPLDAKIEGEPTTTVETAFVISAENEALIRGCQLVIANMTPFRGPSADVGTAYEMGFARGLGLRVFAYTNTTTRFTERTALALNERVEQNPDGVLRDSNAMAIEQWGLIDNLMLDGCVHWSGGELVARDAVESEFYTGLAAFEECLRRAHQSWNSRE